MFDRASISSLFVRTQGAFEMFFVPIAQECSLSRDDFAVQSITYPWSILGWQPGVALQLMVGSVFSIIARGTYVEP